MKIHYALYDSDSANSQTITGIDSPVFWTWWSDELTGSPRDAYKKCNEIVAKLPTNLDKIWGGIFRCENYTILYRFFNAGSYNDSRPGHYVVLTAWIKTDEIDGKELSDVFDDETFQYVKQAKNYPVPKPKELSINFAGKVVNPYDSLISQFSWKSEFVYEGHDHRRAMATWAADKDKRILSLKFEPLENGLRALFELKPLTKPLEPQQIMKERYTEKGNTERSQRVVKKTLLSIILGTLCLALIFMFAIPFLFKNLPIDSFSGSSNEKNIDEKYKVHIDEGPSSGKNIASSSDIEQKISNLSLDEQRKFFTNWFKQQDRTNQKKLLDVLNSIYWSNNQETEKPNGIRTDTFH